MAGIAPVAACGRRKGTGFPGYAFIANETGRSLAAVDLSLFRVARRVGFSSEPSAVIAPPDHNSVFVLTPRTGSVHEVDAESLRIRRSSRVAGAAVSMRVGPDGESIWVLGRDPTCLVRLPLDSFRPSERIRFSGTPEDFDIAAETAQAAIITQGSHGIAIADLKRAAVQRTVDAPTVPHIARFRKDGRLLLAGQREQRSVSILDVSGGRLVVTLPLALEPVNFCSTPDGGQVFITGPGMDAVAVVYPYRTEVAQTLLAGRSPAAMAVTGDRGLVFIANPDSGEVSVLDVATHRIIAVVAVGAEPRHVLITPDAQYALVLNQRSGDVAVIRVAAVIDRRMKMAPLFTMIPVGSKPVSAAVRRI